MNADEKLHMAYANSSSDDLSLPSSEHDIKITTKANRLKQWTKRSVLLLLTLIPAEFAREKIMATPESPESRIPTFLQPYLLSVESQRKEANWQDFKFTQAWRDTLTKTKNDLQMTYEKYTTFDKEVQMEPEEHRTLLREIEFVFTNMNGLLVQAKRRSDSDPLLCVIAENCEQALSLIEKSTNLAIRANVPSPGKDQSRLDELIEDMIPLKGELLSLRLRSDKIPPNIANDYAVGLAGYLEENAASINNRPQSLQNLQVPVSPDVEFDEIAQIISVPKRAFENLQR